MVEGVKNSVTLGLTDSSPWAGDKGEELRAWHDLKYLGTRLKSKRILKEIRILVRV